jgi:hypothetical protein
MYDYYLDGKDNFAIDREAVEQMELVVPEIRRLIQENRAFLRRAVRFMVQSGIRQFVDIGSGLPTVGNTHEVAQEAAPEARVVYADSDPVVLTHGRALLAKDASTTVITADMRKPDEVMGHPETRKLIDPDRPMGVLLIAMTHFLADDERAEVMKSLRDLLPAGSYLAITHGTSDGHPRDVYERVEGIYRTTPTPIYFRSHAAILELFDGFDLVEPGLVTLEAWRPDSADPAPAPTNWGYGGVGLKR